MTTLALKTIARVADCVMRQVTIDGAPVQTYVFIDLTGHSVHSMVTPDQQDLLGEGETRHFDSLPDLAEALRERFQLPF